MVLSGSGLVGLALLPTRRAILTTTNALFTLDWDVEGLPLPRYPRMKAEIIAVGSELLTPDRVDTNSLFLTRGSINWASRSTRKTVVGDEHEQRSRRLHASRCRPRRTGHRDRRTWPHRRRSHARAVADCSAANSCSITTSCKVIEARFRHLGRPMSEVNTRQAMVPEGAERPRKSRGTAPGLWLETDGRIVVLLPGPPHELKAMFAEQVEPRLARLAGGMRLYARELRIAGMGESDVEQRIAPIYTRYTDVQTTILTAPGEIQIHLRTWSKDVPKPLSRCSTKWSSASRWRSAKASSPQRAVARRNRGARN